MTVDEEMVDIIKCVAIFDNTSTDWQKARYLEVIQKDAQGVVKLLDTPDVSDASNPKYDCDDCTYYPCVHQEMVDTTGEDAKLKYNVCGDHSSRGCA